MPCYVIVTCRSMIWTLFTIITSLTTLYCLVSPTWLLGYDRPHSKSLTAIIVPNDTTSSGIIETGASLQVEYYSERLYGSHLYKPTIGLFSRCIRADISQKNRELCGSFAFQFGKENDTFPVAWQVGMVLFGIASLLLVFVTICSILSLCIRDFCRKSLFTISGLIQVIAGFFLVIGEAIYPVGWNSAKVRWYCGADSKEYEIGDCTLGWAYIVLLISTVCIFATGMLSIQADKATSKDEIEEEILEGKHLICIQ